MVNFLHENRVVVYALSLEKQISEHDYHALLTCVPESRRKKIEKFRFRKDSIRSLFSYFMVKYIYQTINKMKELDFLLSENEYGKPYIQGLDDFQFNISHSGDWIVCAVHDLPVGIDIEEIKQIDFSIAQDYFSLSEYEHLCSIDAQSRLAYFYSIWTLKESYIKAVGKGLSIPLNSFSFTLHEDGVRFINKNSSVSHSFREYPFPDGYKLSVCSQLAEFDEKINYIDIYDITN